MGNVSNTDEIVNGDLLVKIIVDDTIKNLKRVGDDIHYTLEVSLLEAIFGSEKQIETIDNNNETISLKPGIQSDEKIVINNRVIII